MPLHTPRLSLYAVGVVGDSPSDGVRSTLLDGVHLRWVFDRDLGFPRHGFHVFRRASRSTERHCLRPELDQLPVGSLDPARQTTLGLLSRGAGLEVTNEFGWRWSRFVWGIGPVGIDLAGRGPVRLDVSGPPRTDGGAPLALEAQIGFRVDHGVVGERIEFWRRAGGPGPNPLVEKGLRFTLRDAAGVARSGSRIVVRDSDPPLSSLDISMGSQGTLDVSFPWPATAVFLRIAGGAGSIEGFTPDGRSAGTQSWQHVEGSYLNAVTFLPGEPVTRVLLRGATELQTFTVETPDRTAEGIVLRAMNGDVEVARTLARGLAGQVVRFRLTAGAPVTAVEVGGGPGVLADLCLLGPGRQGVTEGWEAIAGVPSPLPLPVRHPDYPASGGRPVDLAASRAEALGRVRYGSPDEWAPGFDDLHAQLVSLVEGGPEPAMAVRSTVVPGTPRSARAGPDQTLAIRRYSLDSLLLAALHPAVAQMVGLACVDRTAQRFASYDYLVLAEWAHTPSAEVASLDPAAVLSKLRREGFGSIDGALVLGVTLEPPGGPDAPTGLEVYALPGGTVTAPDGSLVRSENVSGLRWDRGAARSGRLGFEAPVLHHVWRADLGPQPGTDPPAPVGYACLTLGRPLVIARRAADRLARAAEPGRSTAWPPFRLYALDGALPDGWYSYQVSGVDLFGRHSARSAAATWRQWAPVPQPRPWYYQDPPGDRELHPFAVRHADRIPPPPPAAIEASALDPADPYLVRDEAYTSWRASLAPAERDTVVGLRVRWEWPELLALQAPDVREFRIYLQPGRLNALPGRVVAVETRAAGECLVTLQERLPVPRADLPGMVLQVAGRAFPVLNSIRVAEFELRVRGTPATGPCTLVIPEGHRRWTDPRTAATWAERWYVVQVGEQHSTGTGADGRPVRRYEVLLPAPGDTHRTGIETVLSPDRREPVAVAAVGLSAADDRDEVPDAPEHAGGRWPGRTGNEGTVGPPVTVVRVLRARPPAPRAAPEGERSFATRADYHGHSFHTVRWYPEDGLAAHLHRALDDAVFVADRAQRFDEQGAPRSDQPLVDASAAEQFPDVAAEPRWDATKRAAVAAELNHLNDLADPAAAIAWCRALSNDALRILAGLPSSDHAFTQITTVPLSGADPAHQNRVGPDDADDVVLDPGLCAFVDTLDGRARNRHFYRASFVDAAQNRGPMGLASAPVYLPDVVAPRTPTLLGVVGAEHAVTLSWASNREPDLFEYRILRATTRADAEDLRRATLVGTVPANPDPASRPAAVTWTDTPVPGAVDLWYRVVAVDRTYPDPRAGGGNVSPATPAIRARALDTLPPTPPQWVVAERVADGTVRLAWRTDEPGVTCTLQRRVPGGLWRPVSARLDATAPPFDFEHVDLTTQAGSSYDYRVLADDPVGNRTVQPEIRTVPAGAPP